MSFETFRISFASRLQNLSPADLDYVLSALDSLSASWLFSRRSTDLIVSEGLPDAVVQYLSSKSIENLKPGTLKNYYSTLCYFFGCVHHKLDEVTPADVRLFLNWYKQNRHISDSYLDHKRIVLNSFFSWCVDEDYILKNPMRHIKPIRCSESLRLPMTALELEQVRKTCVTLREKALVDFLFSTAARVSEVCSLKISDVDFLNHTVRIEHGKGDKGRVTFLNAESEVSLRAYLDSRTDSDPSLFVTVKNPIRGIKKKTLENEIDRIVSRCSLSVRVTPHVFRHTAASLALQRGMPIEQVQRFLGHAKIQTTLRYAKVLDCDVQLAHRRYVA